MNQISIPDTFTLQDRNIKKQPMYKDNKEGAKKEEPENKLPILFSFKSPVKEFTFQVMMQNKHLTDIRIFKVNYIISKIKIDNDNSIASSYKSQLGTYSFLRRRDSPRHPINKRHR
jgi:hypothetical protein